MAVEPGTGVVLPELEPGRRVDRVILLESAMRCDAMRYGRARYEPVDNVHRSKETAKGNIVPEPIRGFIVGLRGMRWKSGHRIRRY